MEFLPKEQVDLLLEGAGYEVADTTPDSSESSLVYQLDNSLFSIVEEFVEMDDSLYIPIKEMSDTLFESIGTEVDPVKEIDIEGTVYTLTETVVVKDDEAYVLLESQEIIEEDNTVEINGVEYNLVEESEATAYAFITEDEGEYMLVDDEDDAESVIWLTEAE